MIWDELTTHEIDQLERNIPVLISISATEQHGPHLPLATDRIIGTFFAEELHRKIPDQVLILPPVAVGCSAHHMDFAGTLSVSHDAFASYIEEVIESVAEHHFTNIVLLNSHGGNQGIGRVILERLGADLNQMVLITWWNLVREALLKITDSGPGGVGHAGEFETSLMLYIAPRLVKQDLIEPGANQKTYSWAEGDMLRGASAGIYRSMAQMTPNGVYGDPTHATAKKGEQIASIVIQKLQAVILDMIKN